MADNKNISTGTPAASAEAQKPVQESDNGDLTQPTPSESLDSTRMDIDVRQFTNKESTSTQIRLEDPSLVERVSGGVFAKLLSQVKMGFQKLGSFLQNAVLKIKFKREQQTFTPEKKQKQTVKWPVSFDLWGTAVELSTAQKVLFYVVRVVLCLFVAALLAVEVLSAHSSWLSSSHQAWMPPAVALIGVTAALLVLVFKLAPIWSVAAALISSAFLLLMQSLSWLLPHDITLFVFGKNIDGYWNQIWLVLVALEVVYLILLSPVSKILRAVFALVLMYGCAGLILNLSSGTTLEAGWMPLLLASVWPQQFLFLSPIHFFLGVYWPLSLLGSILILAVYFKKLKEVMRLQLVVAHLLFVFVLVLIGGSLLQENRQPGWVSLIKKPALFAGSAELKIDNQIIILKTKTDLKEVDQDNQYEMSVGLRGEHLFEVTVTDVLGRPVYSLAQSDFDLTRGETELKDWKWTPQKGGTYRLEVKGDLPPASVDVVAVPAPTAVEAPATEASPSVPPTSQPVIAEAPKKEPWNVVSPLDGDFFENNLLVMVQFDEVLSRQVKGVKGFIDQKPLFEKMFPPFAEKVDTTLLVSGEHHLKIVVELQDSTVMTREVLVKKGPYAAVAFAHPTFGEYLTDAQNVVVNVAGSTPYEKLELFLDDQTVPAWTTPVTGESTPVVLPIKDLKLGAHALLVKGSSASGAQASDWILVNVGEGTVQISSDSVGVSPYPRVALVLDASRSQVGYWQGETRWNWQKKILSDDALTTTLKNSQVGLFVAGGEVLVANDKKKPANDNDDFFSPFSKDQLLKKLATIRPAHCAGYKDILKTLLTSKPEKVVFITDDGPTCAGESKAELEDFANQLGTARVELLVLPKNTNHPLDPTDWSALQKVRVTLIDDTSKVLISPVLLSHYRLVSLDRVVVDSVLDGAEKSLLPGTYRLEVETWPLFEPDSISVHFGQKTLVPLKVSGDKTVRDQGM